MLKCSGGSNEFMRIDMIMMEIKYKFTLNVRIHAYWELGIGQSNESLTKFVYLPMQPKTKSMMEQDTEYRYIWVGAGYGSTLDQVRRHI